MLPSCYGAWIDRHVNERRAWYSRNGTVALAFPADNAGKKTKLLAQGVRDEKSVTADCWMRSRIQQPVADRD
jgi:hypothetical protein